MENTLLDGILRLMEFGNFNQNLRCGVKTTKETNILISFFFLLPLMKIRHFR